MVRQLDPHGTAQRYGQRCRCALCREAWAMYMLARRRQHGQRPRRIALALKRLPRGATLQDEPYYEDRNGPLLVRPTVLGRQILEAAQVRTGRDVDDIVEHLLRGAGARLVFDEPVANARSTE